MLCCMEWLQWMIMVMTACCLVMASFVVITMAYVVACSSAIRVLNMQMGGRPLMLRLLRLCLALQWRLCAPLRWLRLRLPLRVSNLHPLSLYEWSFML